MISSWDCKGKTLIHHLDQVILVGTVPWLHDLCTRLSANRRQQLRFVRSFLKLETTTRYVCSTTGKTKCVRNLLVFELATHMMFSFNFDCYLGFGKLKESYLSVIFGI